MPVTNRRRPNGLKVDPTRTATLRRQVQADLRSRFATLRQRVGRLVVAEDVFGLRPSAHDPFALGSTLNAVGAVTAHKPAGPGGGQFTSGSGGGGGGAGRRFTGKLLARLKGAGAKAGHVEHAAKEWAAAKVQKNVEKLPPRTQRAVKAAFTVGKVATKAAFATWTAGQHLAERVAKERGATPEQAAKLRGVLSSLDMATFKPVSVGLGATGLGAATIGAASMIPPATAGYLAYSTARNPLATARAAKGMVSDALARVSGKRDGAAAAPKEPVRPSAKLGGVTALPARNALFVGDGETLPRLAWDDVAEFARLTVNLEPSDTPSIQMTRLVAAALELHDYSDWYVALLSAALDATGDVGDAIDLANEVAGENPEDVSAPAPDDEASVIQRPSPFRNGQPHPSRQPRPSSPVENVRWKFHDLTSKVRAFLDWFGAQVKDVFADAPAFLSGAARQAFGKGVGRTYDDARKPLSDPTRDATTLAAGAREEFLRSTLSLPQEADRLRALGQRATTDLTNALGDATTRAGRAVTDGLSRRESPAELAKGLYAAIDEGARRAAAVAHDVVVRSQAEGQLTAAETLGAREVAVEAEWLTARDGRVCTLCASYSGRSMPVAKARGLIPLHVSCRCAWVPKWVLPPTKVEAESPPILNVLRDARTIDRFDALLTDVLRNATADVAVTNPVTNDVVDQFKHAHKGAGPGGGQFTSKGGAPSVPAAKPSPAVKAAALYEKQKAAWDAHSTKLGELRTTHKDASSSLKLAAKSKATADKLSATATGRHLKNETKLAAAKAKLDALKEAVKGKGGAKKATASLLGRLVKAKDAHAAAKALHDESKGHAASAAKLVKSSTALHVKLSKAKASARARLEKHEAKAPPKPVKASKPAKEKPAETPKPEAAKAPGEKAEPVSAPVAKPVKPPKEKAPKPDKAADVGKTVESVKAKVEDHANFSTDAVKAALQGHTIAELHQVHEGLSGFKLAGAFTKGKLINWIADSAAHKAFHKGQNAKKAAGDSKAHENIVPKEARPKLTKAEGEAVEHYTAEGYSHLNAALYRGTKVPNFVQTTHEGLQSAFTKVKEFKEPLEVHRGLTLLSHEGLDKYVGMMKVAHEGGGVVTMPGYQSTSTNKSSAFGGNVKLVIQAVHGLDAKPHSAHEHEDEVLLNHNSRFKVEGVHDAGHGAVTVHLRQLRHDES